MRRLARLTGAALVTLLVSAASAWAQAIPIERADVNGDCVVTQADLDLVIASYNKRTGQPGFNPAADVNRDGTVTLTDRTFVQRAIGTRVCTPQQPPPTIAAMVAPAANAAGWHRDTVTVTFTCTGATSCPAAVTVSSEGANQVVERVVTNTAGVSATGRVNINLDRTPPLLAVTLPSSGAAAAALPLAVAGTDLSGLASVVARTGGTTIGTDTSEPFSFSVTAPAAGQSRSVEVIATDRAGNVASVVRSVSGQAADTTPPVTSVDLVSVAAPGARIPITALATDPAGVARLTLGRVEGSVSTLLATVTTAPFSVQHAFTVPQVADGTVISFVARGEDAAGNGGTATGSVTVRSTVASEALVVTVDPPVSPTFQTSTVLRGRLAAGSGTTAPTPPAFIAGLSVTQGRLGQTLDVGITGANTGFEAGTTQANFGAGITVEQIAVQGPDAITVRIRIDPRASLGPRIVALSTGRREALLPHAFNVVAGLGTISGRLVTIAGAPIAQGSVCLAGSTACAASSAAGTFILTDVPTTTGRVVATAAGFQSGAAIISLSPGGAFAIGDLVLEASLELPPPPPPNTPALAPRMALILARMFIVQTDPTSLTAERARQTVVDSILLVGADELGVLDAEGRQLNPEIAGAGTMSMDDRGVSLQARGLVQGATISLEELAFGMALMFEWSDGPLDPTNFVADLQARVNEAWANPTADGSELAMLLFNQGPTLAALPPRLTRQTRVNSLQAFLMVSGITLQGYHAQRPGGTAAITPALPLERPGILARLGRSLGGVAALLTPRGALPSGGASASFAGRWAPRVEPPFEGKRPRVLDGLRPVQAQQGGGGAPTHRVRQLSRLMRAAHQGFAQQVTQNLFGAALFALPAACAAGGLTGVTMAMAVVGAFVEVFAFGVAVIPIIAKLAPPPPVVDSVRQVGNKVIVRIQRVEFDKRCIALGAQRQEGDPPDRGLCAFQYSLYRWDPSTRRSRLVTARYQPPSRSDVAAGVFEMEDPTPSVGLNAYYVDVTHRLGLDVPPDLRFLAGSMSIPTRIPIPVGQLLEYLLISELISDFSEPNPYPLLTFRTPTDADWSRVQLTYAPQPPTTEITAMRSDLFRNVFANDVGLAQFSPQVPGSGVPILRPSFGRGVGLDIDAAGNLYSVSESSQGQFGGRVFQIRRDGSQHLVGSVNRYSPLLDTGNPVNVSAIALGPGLPSAGNAFVPGDLFVADNSDRKIKRLHTSIIPAVGLSGLPAPGHGIFGSAAAVPIVGQPYFDFPRCSGPALPIRDIVIDRGQTMWALMGTDLYRVPYDSIEQGPGTPRLAASLSGAGTLPSAVDIKVRGSSRATIATAHRGKLMMVAEAQPCAGDLEWESTDEEVLSVRTVATGPGFSRAEVIGRGPGKARIRARFTPRGGGSTATDSIEVTVYRTGPVLLVHGWRGIGSNYEPVAAALEQKGLLRGGSLCASWTRRRGRWARVKDTNESLRAGNTEQFVCDEAAEDGSVFLLNFEDNQNSYLQTAGELSEIVDQIQRAIGGEDCTTAGDPGTPFPPHCPQLTVVAHSMGGQTARAYIQGAPHETQSVPDFPQGSDPNQPGGREAMPRRAFRGQIAKLVTMGTMNLGTPAPNLSEDEAVALSGISSLIAALSTGAGQPVDIYSYAIRSMAVNSNEWQLLSSRNLDALRSLELVSIVTQAPNLTFATPVCVALAAAPEVARVTFNALHPAIQLELAVIATRLGYDFNHPNFVADLFQRVNTKICLQGNDALTGPPVLGSTRAPAGFLYASDMIVGVDSQNMNNLFRHLDGHPDGIVYSCRDETPGVTPGAVAKVVCIRDMLHTASQSAAVPIVAEIIPDSEQPVERPEATPTTDAAPTQVQTPAVAALIEPQKLAADRSGNVFVSDRVGGSVTMLRPDGVANTFVSGLTGVGAIAVQDGYLYAVRNGDVIRIPLGISGRLVEADGQPARNATILARSGSAAQFAPALTDGDGRFTIPLTALDGRVQADQLIVYLTVTTQGTSTVPSRTQELEVPLDVDDTRQRTQTLVQLTLPALQ